MSYDTSRYQWLKEHGICIQCGQRDAFPGYVKCPKCIEKAGISSRRCWGDKEKRIKYIRRSNERAKQLRKERKDKNLCIRCGKALPEKHEYFTCVSCRKRRNEKLKAGRRDCGEAFRERIDAGVCMYCGAEVVPGHKLCEKHLIIARGNIEKARIASNEKWRGEITRQWEDAKLRNSRNG